MGVEMKKIKEELPEIIFIIGLILITTATFLLNLIAGLYVSGVILTGLGFFLAYNPNKKQHKGGEK